MRTFITLTELSPTAAPGKLYFLADQSDTWMYVWHERGSLLSTRHNHLGKLLASDISATDQQLLETDSDTVAGPADWADTHKRRFGALPQISGPRS